MSNFRAHFETAVQRLLASVVGLGLIKFFKHGNHMLLNINKRNASHSVARNIKYIT